jgi:hypothetical protein
LFYLVNQTILTKKLLQIWYIRWRVGFMTKKVLSLLDLTAQLADLKQQKNALHSQLIETNRQIKAGTATKPQSQAIKDQISVLQAEMRGLEHELSILTVMVVQTVTIKETPYGRILEYPTSEDVE